MRTNLLATLIGLRLAIPDQSTGSSSSHVESVEGWMPTAASQVRQSLPIKSVIRVLKINPVRLKGHHAASGRMLSIVPPSTVDAIEKLSRHWRWLATVVATLLANPVASRPCWPCHRGLAIHHPCRPPANFEVKQPTDVSTCPGALSSAIGGVDGGDASRTVPNPRLCEVIGAVGCIHNSTWSKFHPPKTNDDGPADGTDH